jgi:nitrite reductase (NADH) large subunit
VAGQTFGLVAPLYEMAGVLAAQLAGDDAAQFKPSALATKLKVTGINLFSAGDFAAGDTCEDIVLRDPARCVYKRLVLKDDKLIGAVFYGCVADSGWFFDLIRNRTDISGMRDTLIFGPAFASTPAPATPLPPPLAVGRRSDAGSPTREARGGDQRSGGATVGSQSPA